MIPLTGLLRTTTLFPPMIARVAVKLAKEACTPEKVNLCPLQIRQNIFFNFPVAKEAKFYSCSYFPLFVDKTSDSEYQEVIKTCSYFSYHKNLSYTFPENVNILVEMCA